MSRVVLGIGLSSEATSGEVRALVHHVLDQVDLDVDAVTVVATRERFAGDRRLRLGPPVVGVDDAVLLRGFPAGPRRARVPTFPARVAEGCALTGAGAGAELLVGTTRSAHATAAVALAPPGAERSAEHR